MDTDTRLDSTIRFNDSIQRFDSRIRFKNSMIQHFSATLTLHAPWPRVPIVGFLYSSAGDGMTDGSAAFASLAGASVDGFASSADDVATSDSAAFASSSSGASYAKPIGGCTLRWRVRVGYAIRFKDSTFRLKDSMIRNHRLH